MIYRFADCELDEHLYQLRRNGVPVALEPRVFDVLAYLLQHRDRVVSKDELLDKLWPGQVVSETALTQCVMAARKAVGDDGNRQHTIKTQHGRGYRFVAEVVSSQQEEVRSEQLGVSSQQEDAQPTKRTGSLKSRLQGLESDPQSASSSFDNTRHSMFLHSWPRKRVLFIGLFLLVGALIVIRSVPFPSLLTSHSLLFTREAQPPSLPLPDKPSIIVLPFVNLSGDPSQEYFSDGITEEITAALSRLSSLFVIARTSAFTYKGKAAKVQDISKEMGVRYVLEGSARKGNGQLRIIAQLIDATTGEDVWTERYDRPLKDVFTVQDTIVQQIVTTLKLQLTLMDQGYLVRKRTSNLDAYDMYLRGTEFFWRAYNEAKKDANEQARQLLERAITLDSTYADAYGWLGATYFLDRFFLPTRSRVR